GPPDSVAIEISLWSSCEITTRSRFDELKPKLTSFISPLITALSRRLQRAQVHPGPLPDFERKLRRHWRKECASVTFLHPSLHDLADKMRRPTPVPTQSKPIRAIRGSSPAVRGSSWTSCEGAAAGS